MAAPQGYTSLGVIGFTDQGTYDNSTTYYINDLVHYLGNIYRCKVDETSGIAPAENVNWTVFVGAPTNIVEELIAPVEVNPSENAYSVGDQLIYNDILYKVTAAIAIGDSLTVGTNIALSDVVVDQFKTINNTLGNTDISGVGNSVTAAISSLNNDFENISNPNLLDNPWFTVNQRGKSSYTSNDYTVDRWKHHMNSGDEVSVTSNGISCITNAKFGWIEQRIEPEIIDNANGNTFTISAKITSLSTDVRLALYRVSGSTYIATNINQTFTVTAGTETIISVTGQLTASSDSYDYYALLLYPQHNDSTERLATTFHSVKLEIGSVSTLANDTAPNYQQELAKCQRYFQRIQPIDSAYGIAGTGYINTTSRAFLTIPLSVPLRTRPTLSYNLDTDGIKLIDGTTDLIDGIVVKSMSIDHVTGSLATIIGNNDAQTSISVGSVIFAWFDATTDAYIDFSADL